MTNPRTLPSSTKRSMWFHMCKISPEKVRVRSTKKKIFRREAHETGMSIVILTGGKI